MGNQANILTLVRKLAYLISFILRRHVKWAHVGVFLSLFPIILLGSQFVRVYSGSLQADIVKRILVCDIDILLCRHQFYLYMPTDTLHRSEVDSLRVGSFGAPGQIMSVTRSVHCPSSGRCTYKLE